MLFNSIAFAIFLPIVFICYWFLAKEKLKIQNALLLLASYFFYGWWDYRFLLLLIFSITLDFIVAKKINGADNNFNRKCWFWLSIIANISILFFFKYANFFIDSLVDTALLLGFKFNPVTLTVILPLGISFYTFHELSYIIDVYKRRIKPVNNYIDYSLFVTFFPLLVAGPIERATHLLPQVQAPRKFNYYKAVDGLRQILWGLFKKIVIADNCAPYVNAIFGNPAAQTGGEHILGAVLFSIQIYCDFSGYCDIALGTAQLFGFELIRNFANPYFSRDIAEFWRRWHISLTTWFRDYLYIPLGGNKGSRLIRIRNTFIIFLISGFWHGANWTFIAWGLLNAIYFIPLMLLQRNRNNLEVVASGKKLPSVKDGLAMGITFCMVTFAWIFFRATSLKEGLNYVASIFSKPLFSFPNTYRLYPLATVIVVFFLIEWLGREQPYAIKKLFSGVPKFVRWGFYILLLIMIFSWQTFQQDFIYFHF